MAKRPTEGDDLPQRAEDVSSELLRKAGFVTVVAIVIYSVVLALADYQSIEVSVQKLPLQRIALALLLATASFGVRFLRWHGYLRTLEIRTSLPNSLLIFTSGLGMSVTPGKAGEVLKALQLQQVTGTPIARSVPIVAAERVTDAMALLVLGAIGTLDLALGPVLVALSLTAALTLSVVLGSRRVGHWVIEQAARIPLIARQRERLSSAHESMLQLCAPARMLQAFSLALLAWTIHSLCLLSIANAFEGVSLSARGALVTDAAPLLAGALAMLPGGLGLTEASMAGVLIALGDGQITPAVAAAITLAVRVITLWWAVALGLSALGIWQLRRMQAPQRSAESCRRVMAKPPAHISLGERCLRWLLVALGLQLSLNVLCVLALLASGTPLTRALREVGATEVVSIVDWVREDSWMPMVEAYQLETREPQADMYSLFFESHLKWLYLPSSLLVLDLFPAAETQLDPEGHTISYLVERRVTWPSRLICLGTIAAAAGLIELAIVQLAPAERRSRRQRVARVLCVAGLGALFYPLWKGYEIGQIQVFLNGFAVLALLAQLAGRPLVAGMLVGLCCLVKPQLSVCVLAALLLRQPRFVLGFAGTWLSGIGLSLSRYGLHDHLRYLDLLRHISRHGESYWTNQSINGLLNRLLGNGSALEFSEGAYAPYVPAIYVTSLVTGVTLLGLALGLPRKAAAPAPLTRGSTPGAPLSAAAVAAPGLRAGPSMPEARFAQVVTFALVMAAATIGSPVAWEHHYGVFAGIFAVSLAGLVAACPLGRWTGPLLAVSYLAVANAVLRPELLFSSRWLGLLGSHIFLGAMLLFGLLFTLRAGRRPQARASMLDVGPAPEAAQMG